MSASNSDIKYAEGQNLSTNTKDLGDKKSSGEIDVERHIPIKQDQPPPYGIDHAVGAQGPVEGGDAPVAPDQFDPKWETTNTEIWAYYAYYIGNSGLSLFNFAPTQFQNLLAQAAGDAGTLYFANADRSVNEIVLLCNGISFALQSVLFLIIGSYADFGNFRPWILTFWSVVCFAIGFGWMGIYTPDKWPAATWMYVFGLLAYQMALTFWTAAFPGLARNTPELRNSAEEYVSGQITRQEYDTRDMLQRNRLANVAFFVSSVGEVFILVIMVGILFGLHVTDSVANNTYGFSVLVAFSTGAWLLLALPWFFLEKKRPGRDLPAGKNFITVGFWQLWRAIKHIWSLKQSLIYLVGYFLLGDSLNTTVTVIATLSNSIVAYDTLTVTYIYIVGIVTQAMGVGIFWLIQKKYRLSTKTMFNAIMLGIVLLDGWGMLGNWTDKIGFHNVWEVWIYQVIYGLFVCPWYSYSQVMISEVTPRGYEFFFFSLFSIIGKTSSFIGPLVSTAIIQATPDKNNSAPFYFLFGLTVLSTIVLWVFIDLDKSRKEQEAFLIREAVNKEHRRASVTGEPVKVLTKEEALHP